MLANHMVDSGASGRTSYAATVATEGTKKGAVTRTRVLAMKAIDDVNPVFQRFKCLNGFFELKTIERCGLFQTLGNCGVRIKSLVL